MMVKVKRIAANAGCWLRLAATVFMAVWCTLSLHFNSLFPGVLAPFLAVVYALGTVIFWKRSENWPRFYRIFLPLSLGVFFLWCCIRPPHEPMTDDGWSRLHAIMPQSEFNANRVIIHNVRNTQFNPDGDYVVRHEDRAIDISELESIWFGEQHFASFRGIAHTFVSFGFRNGEFLSISAEARRGEGEAFSPLRGFFKQFGLIYVVSSEQDAIGRTLDDDLPTYLYPIRANQTQIQAMFVHMLRRANELLEHPEFYHTAHNNCASNIIDGFNAIAPIHFSQYSPFVALPGYAGRVAFNRGLIDTDKTFADVQQQALINTLARSATDENFSQHIRSNF